MMELNTICGIISMAEGTYVAINEFKEILDAPSFSLLVKKIKNHEWCHESNIIDIWQNEIMIDSDASLSLILSSSFDKIADLLHQNGEESLKNKYASSKKDFEYIFGTSIIIYNDEEINKDDILEKMSCFDF